MFSRFVITGLSPVAFFNLPAFRKQVITAHKTAGQKGAPTGRSIPGAELFENAKTCRLLIFM
jgi:hypothetical protein